MMMLERRLEMMIGHLRRLHYKLLYSSTSRCMAVLLSFVFINSCRDNIYMGRLE